MGTWDDCTRDRERAERAEREALLAMIDALECPRCHQANRPNLASINYDHHLFVADCNACGHCWVAKPAAAA